MTRAYCIPAQALEVVTEVKKSRFIARAEHVTDRQAALAMLEQARQDYPDARHHCWAYLIGNPAPASSAAMNDDGEPSGTAGKPIVNVIQHKGIGDVMVVVSRYFGGIKLGAGGLTRAYSGAAESVLSQLPTVVQTPMQSCVLECDFALEQQLRHWAGQHNAKIIDVEYAQSVRLSMEIPDIHWPALEAFSVVHAIGIHRPDDQGR